MHSLLLQDTPVLLVAMDRSNGNDVSMQTCCSDKDLSTAHNYM